MTVRVVEISSMGLPSNTEAGHYMSDGLLAKPWRLIHDVVTHSRSASEVFPNTYARQRGCLVETSASRHDEATSKSSNKPIQFHEESVTSLTR